MAQKLREGELDVAILLTEAATLFAHKGDVTIMGSFVDTPLTWGVHALAGSNPSLDSRYAVSRMGSGSHLMALVAARQRGAPDPEFEVVGDLQGARKALKNKEADLFMWEKFTTKPLVDSGEWSRVAEVPTPWLSLSRCGDGKQLAKKPTGGGAPRSPRTRQRSYATHEPIEWPARA